MNNDSRNDYEGMQQAKMSPLDTTSPHFQKHLLIGSLAAVGVVGFYLGLVTLTSDWRFAKIQFGEYRWWILSLSMGLGIQAVLYSILRTHAGEGGLKGAKSSLAASGGTSAAAMAACCAHYLAAFLPALGMPFLSAAAASLERYQSLFFLIGVLSNGIGTAFMLRLMTRKGVLTRKSLINSMTSGFWQVWKQKKREEN